MIAGKQEQVYSQKARGLELLESYLKENLPGKLKTPLQDQLILEYDNRSDVIKLKTGSSPKHLLSPCNLPVKIFPGPSRNTLQIETECFQQMNKVPEEIDILIGAFSNNLVMNSSGQNNHHPGSKYSFHAYIQESTARIFQYNAYSICEIHREEGYKVVIKTTIFSYDDFYSDLYREKLADYLAELAHIKFHFNNIICYLFELFRNDFITRLRKNHFNREEFPVVHDIFQIIMKLNSIIEENEAEFRKTNQFRVRPGYGYDDFHLDQVDGSTRHSLQSLIHHMMFEEDIFYPWYLNDEQIDQLAYHIEMFPYKLFEPSQQSDKNHEVQKMLDYIYAECLEFAAIKLFSKGFDTIDVYAQYLSEPILQRIAVQCSKNEPLDFNS